MITDQEAHEFCRALRRVSRLCQARQGEAVSCASLTPIECETLSFIADHPDGGLEELARAIGVSRSRLTRVLDSLEKKELIERKADKEDRRSARVLLTMRGRTRCGKAERARLDGARQMMEKLAPADRPLVLDVLNRLIKSLENTDSKAV